MIVFTTYADTAQYLFDELKDKLRVFKYSSSDANKKNKEMIKCNFDAGIPENKQRDDYDILIATDAISEGYNLHRAGAIFNYDIPYNPTRVIQRVGRINRVNKKVFDKLFIYNFFPTDIGEQETGVKRIATLKKAMINALLGEDTKVLTCDEELESFFKERFREAFNDQEEESWDTPYIKELGLIKKNSPELLEKARAIPKRVRIQRSIQKDIKGVLVFGKKGNDSVFKLGINNKDIIPFSGNEALINFNAEFTEKSKRVSSSFEEIYNNVKEKLFSRKTQVPYKKGRRDAINKLKILLEKLPEKIDYLEDLITVIERLDALTDYHARFIRSISLNNLDFEFLKLQKAIPHKYIIGIIEKAKKIDEGKEYLILSEEFI
jgi:superfamily II DNA/RNA helicase